MRGGYCPPTTMQCDAQAAEVSTTLMRAAAPFAAKGTHEI
ncbi:hypothetical protein EPIB2_1021 [Tritonibacter mobilis]|nr:hypothetical protein EPIB2_1021 [Tritonibacter mobilis]